MTAESTEKPSISAFSIRFGVITGLLLVLISLVQFVFRINPQQNGWIGWVSLLLPIGIIWWMHTEYKKANNGYMSFGEGFQMGFLMYLIGGLISVSFTIFYTSFIDTTFWENILREMRVQMEQQNPEMNDEALEMMDYYARRFFSPLGLLASSLFGLGLFGSLVSLIITAITRVENKDPFAGV